MATGGDERRKCLDFALRLLARRAHSRFQLLQKLRRHRFAAEVIEEVLADLTRRGYVNDVQFAQGKAEYDLNSGKKGKQRVMIDLVRAGVSGTVAEEAVKRVFEGTDQGAVALELAMKHKGRLSKLEPQAARRRLFGLLQRRGFEMDVIRGVVERTLGGDFDEG